MRAVLIFLVFWGFVSSAKAMPLTAEDFIAPSSLIDAELSPSGKRVATVWNVGDKREVRVIDLVENKVISRFSDHIIRPQSVAWANEERLLTKLLVPAYADNVRNRAKKQDDFDIDDYYMFSRILATDIYGKQAAQLMADEKRTRKNFNLSNISHYLPNDKEHILMTAWRRGFLTQYKVNIYTGESEILAKGSRFTLGFINSEDGELRYSYDYRPVAKVMEIQRYLGDGDWQLYERFYIDEESRYKNRIEIKDLVGSYKDQLVYRKKNEQTGFYELLVFDEQEKVTKVLHALENQDILGVVTDSFSDEVIGYTTLVDHFRTYYFDEQRRQYYESALKHFPNESFSFVSFTNDSQKALIYSFGQNNPGSYYLFDRESSEVSLFSYPYSSLPWEELAYGTAINVETRDKATLRTYVLLPPSFQDNKLYPLVVMPHGGPQSRDFAYYSDFDQYIATRGYIVVKPNFRGSTGYGKAFEEAGYKQWGGLMQDDLEDTVEFFVRHQLADPQRVCIVGISYGGYAALMGAIKTPDLYQCSVSINGVTDLPDQLEFDLDKFKDDEIRQYLRDSIGDPFKDRDMLRTNSPARNAKKITIPVLLVASEKDSVVPFEQSELMFDALDDLEKDVSFIEIEDAGHNPFIEDEDILTIFSAVEKFLHEHIGSQLSSTESH